MKAGTRGAPSAKSFEDALLAELLAVHEELQRARPRLRSHKRARPEPRVWRHYPRRRAREGAAAPGSGSGRNVGGRIVVGVLAISAAIVLGAVALTSLHSPGQSVTIRPAAQGGLPPGTVVVAEEGAGVDTYAPGSAGDVVPGGSLINAMDSPVTLAFDPAGDLWVANAGNNNLVEFAKAELAKPDPLASVTISSASVANLFGMAFDQAGDLWLVNNLSNDVIEFTRSQLARSGSPMPRATISAKYFNSPGADAFDSSGDLWVANADGNDLVEFAKAELAKPDPAPTVTISSYRGSLNYPNSIVFDASGDLWVGNFNTGDYNTPTPGSLVEFTKSQLAKPGHPAPAVTISPDHSRQSIAGPFSAFDPAGDLWVSNYYNNTVVEFAKGQLAKSGDPTPVRTIAGPKTGLSSPTYILVEP
jgi:sugar lactone lactonase YvrE